MDDRILKQNIEEELEYEPSVNSARIGVSVTDGVVTLSGHVPNFAQKFLAESAVKRVHGVRGIAEELEVDLGSADVLSDEEIAKRAATALEFSVLAPLGKIQVKVEKGWLTLTGQVEWDYQRTSAIGHLRHLRGVRGVSNAITVKPRVSIPDVERRIEDALRRSAEVEAKTIQVKVTDGKVTLEGKVHSWADRQAVEHAAWSAPGVHLVNDHLRVA